jgi:hypothetical protein
MNIETFFDLISKKIHIGGNFACPGDARTGYGRGKRKEIFCKEKHAKLIGRRDPSWYQIPDCPLLATKA